MAPVLELETKSESTMEVLANKESVSEDPNDKLLGCASNYEDNTFHMETLLGEQSTALDESENVELNITECVNSSYFGLDEADNQDASESSSSFAATASGLEDGSAFSDAEVESRFFSGNVSSSLYVCSKAFRMRKKKLTAHWRRFIRPLKWRCKWIELQIKEFQSQALKYDRELADYDQRKQQFILENFTLEGYGMKSWPFPSQIQRNKVMKRKKRKRVEDTIDVASYMSHHNLFSYYDKRSIADGAFIDDFYSNPVIPADKIINGNDEFGVNDESSSLGFRDGDNSLEHILWKIDVVQSQLLKLKTRVDKVVSENPIKFASVNKLSLLVPCDALTGCAQNPASPPCNGDRMPVRAPCAALQVLSEYNVGDLPMPENAVSSHREATIHLPDMIESTDQPQFGVSCENTGDGILIHNQAAEEVLHNFEKTRIQLLERPHFPREEQESGVSPVLVPEADLHIKPSAPRVQSAAKSLPTSKSNASKNKRKRGRRKVGSSKWSRRSSG